MQTYKYICIFIHMYGCVNMCTYTCTYIYNLYAFMYTHIFAAVDLTPFGAINAKETRGGNEVPKKWRVRTGIMITSPI